MAQQVSSYLFQQATIHVFVVVEENDQRRRSKELLPIHDWDRRTIPRSGGHRFDFVLKVSGNKH
jgi:hypothetical protein